MSAAPTRLRLDHLTPGRPCGSPRPRGSWWLPAGSTVQHSYEIRLTGPGTWTSGRCESDRSVLVDLPRRPATSWQVRVWTDLGESDWSEPAPWTVVTLPTALDAATWIEPHEPVVAPPGRRPAYQLRHEFTLDGPVVTATAWATAQGIYELFVNGTRVGDLELTPGFTAYGTRLQVEPHDVGELLRPGPNSVEFLLSDGWFRGRHGFERTADGFGDRTAALLALEIDGTTTVTTGPGWWSRPSRITAADLMDGQETDFRLPAPGSLGLDAPGWHPARPRTRGRERLVVTEAPPVRRIEELPPVSVTRLDGGEVVVDFGQNISGWVRLRGLGPAGTRLTLTHGESLDADGRVSTEHLRAFDFASGRPLPAGQVDRVVSAGRADDVFEPRHTTHGFRYVQLDGLPGTPGITAVAVHTDLPGTGRFGCDDDRLEALHRAAVWSLRGNACDVPTDCPQRERSGFTGDWQVHVATAARTHDVAGFSGKWLRDLAAGQWPDGRVPTIAPDPAGGGPSGNAFQDAMTGSAGWGDAAVLVPWELWRAYGDLEILRAQYSSMVRWVEYAATAARGRRHPDRAAARPDPAPHEEFLWDTGGHFGEWLEPGVPPAPDPAADHGIVATAYLAHSARVLGRVAELLGRAEDAARFRRLADAARAAWQREYLGPGATLGEPTQGNHVRALAFGLVPKGLRDVVAGRLAALVAAAGDHVGTGFLTTGLLLPTLADTGHLDVAYRVLLSRGIPSWLEMLDRGATTLWERWDAVDGGQVRGSLNHYSKGAAISFLHTHIAGIRLPENPGHGEAGYRRFTVRPEPGGGLRRAEAEHLSLYGPIRSAWRLDDDRLRLSVEIPPGTRAEIRLPGGGSTTEGPGRHELEARYRPTRG